MTEPYGTYIVCPLEECDWKLRTDVDPTPARYVVTEWTAEGISAAVSAVAHQRAQATEHTIREHLDDHDPLDFLRTIAALRQRLGQYEPVRGIVESNWPRSRR